MRSPSLSWTMSRFSRSEGVADGIFDGTSACPCSEIFRIQDLVGV
jgi:hypothetical protein